MKLSVRSGSLQTGALGCRWRTKREVLDGKGQFICGSQNCSEQQGLDTYEVPFAYTEAGTSKQALVKVRTMRKVFMRGSRLQGDISLPIKL